MVRVESVGDWLLLSSEDTVFTHGARYVVQFETEAQGGLLRIESPPQAAGSQRIELHATWPVTARGSLIVGETRYGLDRVPEVVTLAYTNEDGSEQSLSGFRLTVLPDEPTHKVLPYREMIIALRDGGALAARIEADSEPPPALPTDRQQLELLLCARIAERYPNASPQVSADGVISFSMPDGGHHHIALDNAWARVQAGEVGVVEQFSRLCEPIDTEAATHEIFPLIKAAGTAERFFAEARRVASHDGGTPEPLIHTAFAPGLECLFVRDLPNGMSFITASQLRAAGLDEQALPARAASKLWQSLITVLRVDVGPGVHMLTCGGNYKTALLPLEWHRVRTTRTAQARLAKASVRLNCRRSVCSILRPNPWLASAPIRSQIRAAREFFQPV
ncbi:MAG TPA: hypothetical protein VEQ59_10600 [Polyangiaceae bacterium]|nr:hypothetical protein [Polyangiaceae bacterium]